MTRSFRSAVSAILVAGMVAVAPGPTFAGTLAELPSGADALLSRIAQVKPKATAKKPVARSGNRSARNAALAAGAIAVGVAIGAAIAGGRERPRAGYVYDPELEEYVPATPRYEQPAYGAPAYLQPGYARPTYAQPYGYNPYVAPRRNNGWVYDRNTNRWVNPYAVQPHAPVYPQATYGRPYASDPYAQRGWQRRRVNPYVPAEQPSGPDGAPSK